MFIIYLGSKQIVVFSELFHGSSEKNTYEAALSYSHDLNHAF